MDDTSARPDLARFVALDIDDGLKRRMLSENGHRLLGLTATG
ncbi:MAG: hypothetical protein R6X20_09900 [Phycisphaerae bacterium]